MEGVLRRPGLPSRTGPPLPLGSLFPAPEVSRLRRPTLVRRWECGTYPPTGEPFPNEFGRRPRPGPTPGFSPVDRETTDRTPGVDQSPRGSNPYSHTHSVPALTDVRPSLREVEGPGCPSTPTPHPLGDSDPTRGVGTCPVLLWSKIRPLTVIDQEAPRYCHETGVFS